MHFIYIVMIALGAVLTLMFGFIGFGVAVMAKDMGGLEHAYKYLVQSAVDDFPHIPEGKIRSVMHTLVYRAGWIVLLGVALAVAGAVLIAAL